ncbi:MAG TPA: DUF6571 family protein, partial [Nocardioides sp.]|nr:DUF6571 family protein [Nocardioides sp.]
MRIADGGGGGGGMSVKIDHTSLKGAIEKLSTLASSIESQRNAVLSGTPISLPSLSGGTLTQAATWLGDQEPMLQGLHDIALLLASKGSTVASFYVGTDVKDIKQLLGQTLADNAGMGNPNDPEASEQYLELFQRWQFDPATMAAFQNTLGPEGTLRTLSMWADSPVDQPTGELPSEVQTALVEAMKRSLVTANEPGGFTPPESEAFAQGLVDAATIPVEDYVGRGPHNPSGALNYLLYGSKFNDTFIRTIAEDLDHFEREENEGTDPWGNRPDQDVDFGSYMPAGTNDSYALNMDPMTGLMSAMSHSPKVALDFFSDDDGDPPRAEYYIKERDWESDNYNGIAEVLNAATTDESLIHGKTDQQERAALLASETVHYFGERENKGDLPEILHRFPESGAAEDFAHILSTYMPAVDDGIGRDLQDGDGPDQGSFPIDALGGRNTAPMPVFYQDSLKNFMLMSTSTDQGLGELNAGINDWRGQNLGALADTYKEAYDQADGGTSNTDVLSVTDAKEA